MRRDELWLAKGRQAAVSEILVGRLNLSGQREEAMVAAQQKLRPTKGAMNMDR